MNPFTGHFPFCRATRQSSHHSESVAPNSVKKTKHSQLGHGSQPNAQPQKESTSSNTLVRAPSLANLRTPGKNQAFTSDLNRKACADNVQKVIRTLQHDDEFYQRLNLNLSNGFKSMTTKQFIDIIAYFISILSGKTINTNRPSDCEADILNFIKSLNYSSPVNKSWLKTPTAPHAYYECVALLAWLSDWIDHEDDEHMIDKFYSNECDANFPNVELMQLFSKEIRNGFQLWNAQDERFNELTERLVEKYVIVSMNNHVGSLSELDGLVDDMMNKIPDLKATDCTVHNEGYFNTMVERMHQNEMLLKTLQKNIKEKSDKLAAMDLVYRDKLNTIAIKQTLVAKKQQIVSNQRYDIVAYETAKAKLPNLMQTIELRRTEIETMKEDSRAYQLQMARLMQHKNDAIAKLNRIGFKLTQIILLSKSDVTFDANAVQIDSNASIDDVRVVCNVVRNLVKGIQSQKHQIRFNIEQKKLQLCKLKMLEKHHVDRHEAAKVELQKVKHKLSIATGVLFQRRESCENTIRELEEQLERAIVERDALKQEVSARLQRCALLKQMNMDILAEGERKAAEMLEVKSKMIENLDAAMAFIDKVVNESKSNVDK